MAWHLNQDLKGEEELAEGYFGEDHSSKGQEQHGQMSCGRRGLVYRRKRERTGWPAWITDLSMEGLADRDEPCAFCDNCNAEPGP